MVLSILELIGCSENHDAMLNVLRAAERRTRLKPGCIDCGIFEAERAHAVIYIEKWRSREDLCRHIQSDAYFLVLSSMEFASRRPEIHFLEVPGSSGLEMIKALRAGGKEE